MYALLLSVPRSALGQALSVRIPHVGEGFSFAFDVFLTTFLIAPPTILMGGTIPVLTQALSARLEEATRVHAQVYSFNTAGAFCGALAGAFLLIPQLGLDGVDARDGRGQPGRRRDLPGARATAAAGARGLRGRRDRSARRNASPASRSSSCCPASR